ncbi:MAG: hypothetical protein ACOY3Y_00275 [Acidobacteriota bacterium]
MKTTPKSDMILAAGLLAAAFAGSADAATVNQRQHRQQVRIGQGIASGALTPREAMRLEARSASIARQEAVMRRTGGGLGPAERSILRQRLDHLSGAIWRQKHDGQRR